MFPLILLQISDNKTSTEARQVEGSAEIHPYELMASWIYDEKFLTTMQFLFGTSSFTAAHDDDLEQQAQQ
jgi:hypothetical protein